MAQTLTIFGISGRTGQHIARQAVAAGFTVKGLVRNPEAFPRDIEAQIFRGSVLQSQTVRQVVIGSDVCIIALGSTLSDKTMLLPRATRNIIDALETFHIRRLLVMSSYAVSGESSQMHGGMRILAQLLENLIKQQVEQKQQQEALVTASSLDWTIVRPAMLSNGPFTGKYSYAPELILSLRDRVARADVAAALLSMIPDQQTIGKKVVLTSRKQA